MINKLNSDNKELFNEIVNFIFVKQSLQEYYINTFPKKINEIKKEIKQSFVLYQKNDVINTVVVIEKDIIKYLYVITIDNLKMCLPYLKNKRIIISNKMHFLMNIDSKMINKMKINKTICYNIQIKHNSNYIFSNNNFIIKKLQPYLINEYQEIHQGNIEANVKTLICINNNEMIGYLDYIDDKIINIGYINNTNKQFLLLTLIEYYLQYYNFKQVNYYCDNDRLNELKLLNYNVLETMNIFKF